MNERNMLEQLIIKNLNIVETAQQMLPDIEKKVFVCIDKMVKDWVADQDDWTGKFSYYENEGLYFNPKSWIQEDNDNYALFTLDWRQKDVDLHYLSLLCNEFAPKSDNFMGIYWTFPYRIIGKKDKRQWKIFLNEQFKQYEAELKVHHIEQDQEHGNLFRRIEIDATSLADNYPDNIEDALTPVSEALEDIKNAYPIIEKIYQAALTA